MSLFSLPEGSYQDNENIYKYLRTKKNILFVDCIKKKANVKRQLSPKLFAMNSGATIFDSGIQHSGFSNKIKYSFEEFSEIIYCDLREKKINI